MKLLESWQKKRRERQIQNFIRGTSKLLEKIEQEMVNEWTNKD